MTAVATSALRTLSFGDVAGALWGAVLTAGSGALVVGDRDGHTRATELSGADLSADGSWRLAGDGFELEVQPVTEAAEPGADSPRRAVDGVQQLCRVRGAVSLGGRVGVDCVGARTAIVGADGVPAASVRSVAGWFGPEEAFAVLSLRTADSKGQESDRVAATLFDPEGRTPVADPRLSTTYDGAGRPTRVTLELWIGEGDTEYPRRAAGEAAGAGAELAAAGLELRVVPLRCHSRGQEGGGIYLLATG